MKVDPESLCFLGLFALMGVSQVYLINIHVNLVLTSAFVIVIGCYQSLQLKIDVSQGKNVEVSPLAGGVPLRHQLQSPDSIDRRSSRP